MSATIKYNGSTIASVEDGGSVELDTQGKYMSGNVIVEAAGGGGSSMQSGTMTLAADVPANGNLVVPLSGAITNFVFYVSSFPSSQYPDGWQTVGGVWFNNYAWNFLRYNDVNYTAGQGRTVTATSSSIYINLQYKIPAGSTIKWFGW